MCPFLVFTSTLLSIFLKSVDIFTNVEYFKAFVTFGQLAKANDSIKRGIVMRFAIYLSTGTGPHGGM